MADIKQMLRCETSHSVKDGCNVSWSLRRRPAQPNPFILEKFNMSAHALLDDKDFMYEEQVLKDPFQVKSWLHYLEAKRDSAPQARFILYERAVKALPGSYKLWFLYLKERINVLKIVRADDASIETTNSAFERALVLLHKMPRIWTMYLEHLLPQSRITHIRHTFDNALKALPLTQHDRVWPLYVQFVKQAHVPVESAVRVYRRYVQFDYQCSEEFIQYLRSVNREDEAAIQLAALVNNDNFVSKTGKSRHELWADLCTLITKRPEKMKSLNVDAIIRGGIRRYTQEVGRLWCSLADYYIRLGLFEKARDIYEEAIDTATTVRDFTIVFDAYAQFEENMIDATMPSEEEVQGEGDLDDANTDIDLRLFRLDQLMQRRPFLLNSVTLRQNPHNCQEWNNRIGLCQKSDVVQIIKTYSQAVTSIDPQKATGNPHALWIEFAKFYESQDSDLDNARAVFGKAVQVNFRQVQQLASVYMEWAEMEIRNQHFERALDVMRRATKIPRRNVAEDDSASAVQERLHKNTKLWSFYIDLEESLGTLESTKAAYESVLDLRIATPQLVLNYAALLEENKYFEDSFRVYERGVALFSYPTVMPLWVTYLTKFVERFQGTKLERARDLFEQALEKAPPAQARPLYLMYAKLEEQHGLARRAMLVYDRACQACAPEDRCELFKIYIRRAAESFGVTRTREIYQKAIESLPDKDLNEMCLQFAKMEQGLGEVDRARSIRQYGAQFCDPSSEAGGAYWADWEEFELQFGNPDTYREMLRVKRSAASQFSQTNFMDSVAQAAKALIDSQKSRQQKASNAAPMAPLVNIVEQPVSSIGQKRKEPSAMEMLEAAQATNNPDEIDLDDISEQAVPDAVFGDAKQALEQEKMGALARLKKAKV